MFFSIWLKVAVFHRKLSCYFKKTEMLFKLNERFVYSTAITTSLIVKNAVITSRVGVKVESKWDHKEPPVPMKYFWIGKQLFYFWRKKTDH